MKDCSGGQLEAARDEGVKPALRQVRDARREVEPQHMGEREDVVPDAAPVVGVGHADRLAAGGKCWPPGAGNVGGAEYAASSWAC